MKPDWLLVKFPLDDDAKELNKLVLHCSIAGNLICICANVERIIHCQGSIQFSYPD